VASVASSGTSAVGRLAPGILRAAGLGSRCPVASVTRLAGGSKKGVYRLGCSGGFSAVLYVWSAAEDFWPASGDGGGGGGGGGGADAGVFGHASGLGLFSAASRRLTEAGVRVPLVYLTDASRALYPADIALVEDVRGGTLEELLAADPSAAAPVMERLGEMLRSMWGQRAARVGRVANVPGCGDSVTRIGASSERIVLERALRQLAGAAGRVPSVATAAPRLDETLRAAPITSPSTIAASRWSSTSRGPCTSTSSGSTPSCGCASAATTSGCG